jgi:hypothetical protein
VGIIQEKQCVSILIIKTANSSEQTNEMKLNKKLCAVEHTFLVKCAAITISLRKYFFSWKYFEWTEKKNKLKWIGMFCSNERQAQNYSRKTNIVQKERRRKNRQTDREQSKEKQERQTNWQNENQERQTNQLLKTNLIKVMKDKP